MLTTASATPTMISFPVQDNRKEKSGSSSPPWGKRLLTKQPGTAALSRRREPGSVQASSVSVSRQIFCLQARELKGEEKSIKKLFVYKHPGRAHVQRALPDKGWGGRPEFQSPRFRLQPDPLAYCLLKIKSKH